MSDLLWQSLTISVMGMGLTFAALGLLILTMILLARFSRSDAQPPVPGETVPDKNLAVSAPVQDTEEEISAAIAVALVYLRSTDVDHGDLGATLEAGRGLWWLAGRTRQYSANISRTTRWRN